MTEKKYYFYKVEEAKILLFNIGVGDWWRLGSYSTSVQCGTQGLILEHKEDINGNTDEVQINTRV